MSYTLFKRNCQQVIKPGLIFISVLTVYTAVIIYLYDPKLMDMLNGYQEVMPEMMAAMGMSGVATNLIEFVNLYLYGFLMMLFPFIFTLVIGNGFVMKYVDNGSMAYLLATPNSRRKIIITQAISLILSVSTLMIILTLIGIACSEIMFPDALDISKYLLLNASALLVQLAVAGIVFAAACICNDSRNFYMIGCGLPLGFYLCSMMGNMGEKLEIFKYFSIYTLFPADRIVSGESGAWIFNLILAGIGIVLFVTGIEVFCKKDLSL